MRGDVTPPQPDPRQEAIEERAEEIYKGWLVRPASRLMSALAGDDAALRRVAAVVQQALCDAERPERARNSFSLALQYQSSMRLLARTAMERAEAQAAREIAAEERECAGMAECDDPDDRPEKLFGYHGES